MRSVHGNHDGRAAFLTVGIVDAAARERFKRSGSPVLSGVTPFTALIDTGATASMISTRVVKALDLPYSTTKLVQAVGGEMWVRCYLFHIAFYADPIDTERRHETAKVHVNNRIIVGGEMLGEPAFDVLLGMDIITTGTLTISSNGTFSFEY